MEVDATVIEQKLQEYSKFIETALLPERQLLKQAEEEIRDDMNDYASLLQQLQKFAEQSSGNSKTNTITMEPLVDLGYQKVFCKAKVESVETLHVHVGMGFHVELTLVEAMAFIERRLQFLDSKLQLRTAKTSQVEQHIQSSEIMLDQLSRELQKMN